MKTIPVPAEILIPPALLEQVEALAAAEHRPAADILRDAITGYLFEHRSAFPAAAERLSPPPKLTPQQAGARILERRKFRPMPEGETIKSLIDFGRA